MADGVNKKNNGKTKAMLVAVWVLLGLLVLALCVVALSYFGIVELPFGNKTQHSAQVSGNADMEEGEITRPSQTEDPTQDTQPHTHSFVQQQVVEATCTQGGYTLAVCDCGESQEENPVQPLGHSYESKTTAAGTVYTCTRCEDTYTQTDSGSETGNAQTQTGEPSLNKTDFTLTKKGEVYTLRLRYQNGEEIKTATWTSSDPAIATVDGGKVTAVARGTVTVTATFNGKDYTCKVRCRLPEAETPGGTGGQPADKEDGDVSIDISTPADPDDDDISIPITPGSSSGLVENGVIDFEALWGTRQG